MGDLVHVRQYLTAWLAETCVERKGFFTENRNSITFQGADADTMGIIMLCKRGRFDVLRLAYYVIIGGTCSCDRLLR
jgi:hypothetical protein